MSEFQQRRFGAGKITVFAAAVALAAGCSSSGAKAVGKNSYPGYPKGGPSAIPYESLTPHKGSRCVFRAAGAVVLSKAEKQQIVSTPDKLPARLEALKNLKNITMLLYNAPETLNTPRNSYSAEQKSQALLDNQVVDKTRAQLLDSPRGPVIPGFDARLADNQLSIVAVQQIDPSCTFDPAHPPTALPTQPGVGMA